MNWKEDSKSGHSSRQSTCRGRLYYRGDCTRKDKDIRVINDHWRVGWVSKLGFGTMWQVEGEEWESRVADTGERCG